MKMRTCDESRFTRLHFVFCLLIFLHHGASSSDNTHLSLSHNKFTGAEGSEVKVNCHAIVTEKPRELKWISSHDQEASSQSKSSDGNTVQLIISSLGRFDAGTYTCLLVMANGEEETAKVHILVRPRNRDTQVCRTTQFKCKVTKQCIFLKYRCDGKDDCGDGSDEECPGDPCANRFMCNNTRCVDHRFRCDHVDNCGDNSDERACYDYRYKGDKASSTADPTGAAGDKGDDDEDNYSWVKSTIYTIIASTIGLVILISIGVILVFRAKMKRIRERRMVRALNAMQIYGGLEEPRIPPMTGDGCVEEEPFLPRTAQRYHQGPSIIFNVNNGVQYMPRYRYFVENPPPYSEILGGEGDSVNGRNVRSEDAGGGGEHVNTPPPYSTLDRSGETSQEIEGNHNGSNCNNVTTSDLNRNQQRIQRNCGTPSSGAVNNSTVRSGVIGVGSNSNNSHSSSSSPPQAGHGVWGTGHSRTEYCSGCVHCIPSYSTPSASGVVVSCGEQRPPSGMELLNHHPSISQGQGPVSAGRQQRSNEQHHRTAGNTQLSDTTLSQLTGIIGDFRGIDINSHLLQNLLTSSSSSSSHNDSQRLTASVDSESCSNDESHGSGASSSSSCGDDSVSSCTLLGVAGSSSNGRDSIHETETLKTRDRDVPCLPLRSETQQHRPEQCSLPNVDNDNSCVDEPEPLNSNQDVHPDLETCSANNVSDDITSISYTNRTGNISTSSLPNSTPVEAEDSSFGVIESNNNQHLLMDEGLNSHNDLNVSPVASSVTHMNYNDGASTSHLSDQTIVQPPIHSSNVSSDFNLNQNTSEAAPTSMSPMSASSAELGNNDACSALLQEVANRDRTSHQKAKQGHLSVHKGQIVLHTSDGILAGQSIIPIVPSSPSASCVETTPPTHLSGEIIVKDGNIMLQIPVGRSLAPAGHIGFPCMENIAQQQISPPSPISVATPANDDQNLMSQSPSSLQPTLSPLPAVDVHSSQSQPSVSSETPKPDHEMVSGGDLNIRNGQLVLEPPKPKTPSSQILSHLQGAECLSSSLSGEQEEEDGVPVGPVANDKRQRPATGSGAAHHRHHPSTSKSCNSDIVLPRGKN